MKKIFKRFYYLTIGNRFIRPVIQINIFGLYNYLGFIIDYFKYKSLSKAEKLKIEHILPMLSDKSLFTGIDYHYFYQDIWAAKKIIKKRPQFHVDIGSHHKFVGFLTTFTKVKFVDIRPLSVNIDNLENIKGDILNLPFADNSISSLSCLHVAEHIGLGRYGDELNPLGTQLACEQLTRILAVGGNLYFSLPIGKERICFNAHRIHSISTILKYFQSLRLIEFSIINDRGEFISHAKSLNFIDCRYSCGLFHFTK